MFKVVQGAWRRWLGRQERRRTVWALALCAAVLGGCGGSGGGGSAADSAVTQPPSSASATLTAAGGSVVAADGASVTIPADALDTTATIRIAKDSTGAPAIPSGLMPAGDIYAITPHGSTFAKAVEVKIPVPAVTLQPGEQIKLAQAELGGTWFVHDQSSVSDGMLTANVYGFSVFMAVIVQPPPTNVQLQPLNLSFAFDCLNGFYGTDSCPPIGPINWRIAVTSNGGQLAPGCTANSYSVNNYLTLATIATLPIGGGIVTGTLPQTAGVYGDVLVVIRRCATDRLPVALGSFPVYWSVPPNYPYLSVVSTPPTMDVVSGQTAALQVILGGGPYARTPLSFASSADRVIVDWERSDDQGKSWVGIARSYQSEAVLNPVPGGLPRMYWAVSHGWTASTTDQGALIRIRACYTPPEPNVAPPPCVQSGPTAVNVLQQSALPTFTAIPRPVLIQTSQTASLTAAAAGAPAPALQWQTRDANSNGAWTDVSTGTGATTGNFTTPSLTLADNGRQYRVVATNAVGTAESQPVTVSVSDQAVAPRITTQPASLSVTTGNDAAFAISATGTEPLSYHWRFNGTPISGTNSPVLRLARVDASKAGAYSVVVSNGVGSQASQMPDATLTVSAAAPAATAPTIVSPPASVTVNTGSTANFAVGVSGTGPFSYQWLKNGQPVSGATGAAYSVAAVTSTDAGSSTVQVNNSVGPLTASAAATLTVNPSPAPTPLTLTAQPTPQVQAPGGSATFAVAASGTGPITYQWLKDNVALPGATLPVLTVSSINSGDAGTYSVTVSNGVGAPQTVSASLLVLGVPVIGTQPAAASATTGSTATFSVTASGTQLRYLWLRNGVVVPGAASASYTTPALALTDSGAVYSVVVYNGAGAAVSQTAVLTVTTPPVTVTTASVLVGSIGNPGRTDAPSGPGTAARLSGPAFMTKDAAGNVYVTENRNGDVRKITPAGAVTTVATLLTDPQGVAVDGNGNVYVADGLDNTIKRITPAGVVTVFAGSSGVAGYVNAVNPLQARFDDPGGLATDGTWLYVADLNNHAIRRVSLATGAVDTPVASATVAPLSIVDGALGTATLGRPLDVTVTRGGVLYWTEEANVVRTLSGGQVVTVAGSLVPGTLPGYSDGVGSAARFNSLQCITADDQGNLYVTDYYNFVVQKLTFPGGAAAAATVTTVFGVALDGRTVTGTSGRVAYPIGIVWTGTGQLAVASNDSHVVLNIVLGQ